MDTLPNELRLIIMAFLPTFEDRWALGRVDKTWHTVHWILLCPYNDAFASEHLSLRKDLGFMSDRHGPHAYQIDGIWYYGFQQRSKHNLSYAHAEFRLDMTILDCPCLTVYNLDNPMVPYLAVYYEGEFGPYWRRSYQAPWRALSPRYEGGDLFDHIMEVRKEFYTDGRPEPSAEEWSRTLHFDPVLARRIYHFPYFVRLREPPAPPTLRMVRQRDNRVIVNGTVGTSTSLVHE